MTDFVPNSVSDFVLVIDIQDEDNLFYELPLSGKGSVIVNWGDSDIRQKIDLEENRIVKDLIHRYSEIGTYTISVSSGNSSDLTFGSGHYFDGKNYLIAVKSWGDLHFVSLEEAFAYSERNLEVPDHIPESVTSIESIFVDSKITTLPALRKWNTKNVKNMSSAFYLASNFNEDISGWDVSSVEDMSYMFSRAENFDQDLDKWDVSRVKDMSRMFEDAGKFNGKISSWNTSSVENMKCMFRGAKRFNRNISKWDVSSVTDMKCMFMDAKNFNGEIGKWNVSSVYRMDRMFYGAEKFNADISGWDVSGVCSMELMFYEAKNFNQDISKWDVSSVENMELMFYGAEKFNKDISGWNMGKVYMYSGMLGWTSFEHDVSHWEELYGIDATILLDDGES